MQVNSLSSYVLLSMPTNQIGPLSLLTLENKGVVYATGATLEDLFVSEESGVPIAKEFNLTSNIDNTLSLDISVAAHASFLQSLLQVAKAALNFDFQKRKSVRVKMLDAKSQAVNEFDLDTFINNADVNRSSANFLEMLEKNKLFVVTDILKCKKYSMSNTNEGKIGGGVDAGSEVIGEVSVKANAAKAGSKVLENTGEDYITLAIKAYRIYCSVDKKTGQLDCRIRKSPEPIREVLGEEDFPGKESFEGDLLEEIEVNVKQ